MVRPASNTQSWFWISGLSRLLTRRGCLLLALTCLVADDGLRAASSTPMLVISGEPEVIFNWQQDACETWDIPDIPARAFRDADGNVQLIASHYINRRMTGPDLDHLKQDCRVVMRSNNDRDPAHFRDHEWIHSLYTVDGRRIFALIHEEYHGWEYPAQCHSNEKFDCWYNAVTLAVSMDGGATYDHAPPQHVVATVPYRYEPDVGPFGIFNPTNIIRNDLDGYNYVLFHSIKAHGAVPAYKVGVMRTRHVEDPSSWRAWNGRGFDMRFVNPYTESVPDPAEHVFAPISTEQLGDFSPGNVTYNTYLKRFLLVGSAHARDERTNQVVWGFSYSLSDDLIHWTPRRLLLEVQQPGQFKMGGPDPLSYASALDPASLSRNFETTGQRFYIYCTRFNYSRPHRTNWTADRDLIRIPVKFD